MGSQGVLICTAVLGSGVPVNFVETCCDTLMDLTLPDDTERNEVLIRIIVTPLRDAIFLNRRNRPPSFEQLVRPSGESKPTLASAAETALATGADGLAFGVTVWLECCRQPPSKQPSKISEIK
jgi:hypothetical protein